MYKLAPGSTLQDVYAWFMARMSRGCIVRPAFGVSLKHPEYRRTLVLDCDVRDTSLAPTFPDLSEMIGALAGVISRFCRSHDGDETDTPERVTVVGGPAPDKGGNFSFHVYFETVLVSGPLPPDLVEQANSVLVRYNLKVDANVSALFIWASDKPLDRCLRWRGEPKVPCAAWRRGVPVEDPSYPQVPLLEPYRDLTGYWELMSNPRRRAAEPMEIEVEIDEEQPRPAPVPFPFIQPAVAAYEHVFTAGARVRSVAVSGVSARVYLDDARPQNPCRNPPCNGKVHTDNHYLRVTARAGGIEVLVYCGHHSEVPPYSISVAIDTSEFLESTLDAKARAMHDFLMSFSSGSQITLELPVMRGQFETSGLDVPLYAHESERPLFAISHELWLQLRAISAEVANRYLNLFLAVYGSGYLWRCANGEVESKNHETVKRLLQPFSHTPARQADSTKDPRPLYALQEWENWIDKGTVLKMNMVREGQPHDPESTNILIRRRVLLPARDAVFDPTDVVYQDTVQWFYIYLYSLVSNTVPHSSASNYDAANPESLHRFRVALAQALLTFVVICVICYDSAKVLVAFAEPIGGAGKSTFGNIIGALIGPHQVSKPPKIAVFLQDKFDPFMFQQKHLFVFEEDTDLAPSILQTFKDFVTRTHVSMDVKHGARQITVPCFNNVVTCTNQDPLVCPMEGGRNRRSIAVNPGVDAHLIADFMVPADSPIRQRHPDWFESHRGFLMYGVRTLTPTDGRPTPQQEALVKFLWLESGTRSPQQLQADVASQQLNSTSLMLGCGSGAPTADPVRTWLEDLVTRRDNGEDELRIFDPQARCTEARDGNFVAEIEDDPDAIHVLAAYYAFLTATDGSSRSMTRTQFSAQFAKAWDNIARLTGRSPVINKAYQTAHNGRVTWYEGQDYSWWVRPQKTTSPRFWKIHWRK